jgi:ketol-acid reductoisomerase
MHEDGISGMRRLISETAKWGEMTAGPKIVDRGVEKRMAALLREIRNGRFAREWIRENKTGRKRYLRLLAAGEKHPIEKIGRRLRGRMSWTKK